MEWYNRNFNKLLYGMVGTPMVIGVATAIITHEPFFGALGAGGAFTGTFAVELIGASAELKDKKRLAFCEHD